MTLDVYAWKQPRGLDADGAAALVGPWLAAGGEPAASPFEPSTDVAWFVRELARDAPGLEVVTDGATDPGRGPIWLQTDDPPPARVAILRLSGRSAAAGAVEDLYGLAAKYDLVLYLPARAAVAEPLAEMLTHASETFWPGGAIQAAVAGLAGLAAAVVAWVLSIPIVSGIVIVVGGFMAVMALYTFIHEGRATWSRRRAAGRGPGPS